MPTMIAKKTPKNGLTSAVVRFALLLLDTLFWFIQELVSLHSGWDLCQESKSIYQLQAIPWFRRPRFNKSPLRWPRYGTWVMRIKFGVTGSLTGRGISANCQRESEARPGKREGGSMLIEENHIAVSTRQINRCKLFLVSGSLKRKGARLQISWVSFAGSGRGG